MVYVEVKGDLSYIFDAIFNAINVGASMTGRYQHHNPIVEVHRVT